MGQVINKQVAPIGQAIINKVVREEGRKEKRQTKEELSRAIEEYLDKRYPNFEDEVQRWRENEFCQVIYETVEAISQKNGSLHLQLPSINFLRTTFNEIHTNKESALNKKEFQKIIEKVIKVDSFHIGQGAKDVLLYIFGAPIVALMAKRIIPGPTASISDDVFLPAVTSGTVYYLAKAGKL